MNYTRPNFDSRKGGRTPPFSCIIVRKFHAVQEVYFGLFGLSEPTPYVSVSIGEIRVGPIGPKSPKFDMGLMGGCPGLAGLINRKKAENGAAGDRWPMGTMEARPAAHPDLYRPARRHAEEESGGCGTGAKEARPRTTSSTYGESSEVVVKRRDNFPPRPT